LGLGHLLSHIMVRSGSAASPGCTRTHGASSTTVEHVAAAAARFAELSAAAAVAAGELQRVVPSEALPVVPPH